MSSKLNPDKALIFRIVHRTNVPWILENGIYCSNARVQDENYRTIGNPDLIQKRQHWPVPIPPGGVLSDYIPFYFTPWSPMMYNIKTGYGGITKVPNDDIVIFVSSLHRLNELRIRFVFTDRHAKLDTASFFNDVNDLDQIDWPLLQSRDFKRDLDDPGKFERYQAEALVHKHIPVKAFLGVVCYTDEVKKHLVKLVDRKGASLKIDKQTGWYF